MQLCVYVEFTLLLSLVVIEIKLVQITQNCVLDEGGGIELFVTFPF